MPTQPSGTTAPTNLTPGQHARNYWWNPNNRPLRNVGNIIRNVLVAGGNPLIAAGNTARAVAFGEGREAFNNWRNNQSPSVPGGAPLPSWMGVGAGGQSPSNPGNWSSSLPNYNQDQTHAGPPAPNAPGYGVLAPTPQSSGPVGPSRNNNTIAEGDAAVDWARGLAMANSGLNASGGSYDYLNALAGRMQR